MMNLTVKTKFLNFFRQLFFFRPLENMLVSLNQGGETSSLFSKLVPNHYQYQNGTVRKVKRGDINYKLDLSDIVDWYIYYGFKDPVRPVLFSYVNPGDVIIDIGANMGETSFNFSKLVGTEGRVIGFEPDKDNYRRLTDNLKLNNFTNLSPINKGIGNVPGSFLIKMNEIEPGNAGSKRIIGSSEADSPDEMIVEIIRLDDYLKDNELAKLDMIKMDIEGYEFNAIQGAKETIKKYRPKMFLEMQDIKLKEQGSSGKLLVKELQSLGYKVMNAESGKVLQPNSIADGDYFDIVCLYE